MLSSPPPQHLPLVVAVAGGGHGFGGNGFVPKIVLSSLNILVHLQLLSLSGIRWSR
jgi:hypothetical protein